MPHIIDLTLTDAENSDSENGGAANLHMYIDIVSSSDDEHDNSSDEQEGDLEHKLKIAERQIWSHLIQHNQAVFEDRKKTVKRRIDELIRMLGGHTVHVPADGNCLVNSFGAFLNRGRPVDSVFVQRERLDIVQYTMRFPDPFPTVTQPQQYERNGVFLLGEHVKAFHLLRNTNVVVLTYCPDNDDFSRLFFFNPAWSSKPCCTLLFTEFGSGHYDFVAGIHSTLEPDNDFVSAPKGSKCRALTRFDAKYDYQAMMNLIDPSSLIQAMMNVIGNMY